MKHPKPTPLSYRPSVGILLMNHNKEIFIAQRRDFAQDAWQLPQGGIDEGETPLEAGFREMKEEIGTDNAEFLAESQDWHNYDFPQFLIPRLWKGQYRGQRQKWLLFKFLGNDSEINIETNHPEFSQWRWAKAEDVVSLAVHFKRSIYNKIILEFQRYFK